MPEGMAIEVAHKLTENEHAESAAHHRWHTVLEIVEVAMLAVVAILTAWSGYQAAQWDGEQSVDYGQASRTRFQADALSTHGGQLLGADATMFNAWLAAHDANKQSLMTEYERRFSPGYHAAFTLGSRRNRSPIPKAPAGPGLYAAVQEPGPRPSRSTEREGERGLQRRDPTPARLPNSTFATPCSLRRSCSSSRSPSAAKNAAFA